MATEPLDGLPGLGESLRQAVNDWLVAELGRQRRELHALRGRLDALAADRGRPADREPADRLAALTQRIEEVNRRLDFLSSELGNRLDEQAARLDGLFAGVQQRLDHLNGRLDEAHARLGRLADIAVRRDEHLQLQFRHERLDRAVEALRERLLHKDVTPGR